MPTRAPLLSDQIGVLVVEDEPILLLETADVFTEANMSVFEARHADEALAILSVRDDIRVVITDLDMPLGGMGGHEFVRSVTARWPEIGVVVVSGIDRPRSGQLPSGVQFRSKPCDGAELVSAAYAIVSRQTGSI
ncbi:response regulator [Methylobacterium sp. E-005]|uniref:response regulator n=1 Tax=Methylobacterium sp. E-005 TaxID=2836549 RepID=UPI001FB9ED70|nr:response regulator [Methylobacterium sp. E-005]MCJ2085482.1 response regulator [Methylobacterium sp. E-005]